MEFIEYCMTGPNLPATVFVILLMIYGFFVSLGALDFELFDFDVDIDAGAITSIGYASLKFLNIGNLPLMIWITLFGLSWWTLSLLLWYVWDLENYEARWQLATKLVVRNGACGVAVTKVLTQPLTKYFERQDEYTPEKLIGQRCVVSTVEATPDFGQAKYLTDGTPLLLNVKTEAGKLVKGDRAVIVDFDPTNRTYLIANSSNEVQK